MLTRGVISFKRGTVGLCRLKGSKVTTFQSWRMILSSWSNPGLPHFRSTLAEWQNIVGVGLVSIEAKAFYFFKIQCKVSKRIILNKAECILFVRFIIKRFNVQLICCRHGFARRNWFSFRYWKAAKVTTLYKSNAFYQRLSSLYLKVVYCPLFLKRFNSLFL